MEQELKEMFKGYHLEIRFYPAGGMIEAEGCEECGTDEKNAECASWKIHKGQDIGYAVNRLKQKLGID